MVSVHVSVGGGREGGGGGRDQAEFNRAPSSNQLKLMSLTVDPATITAGPFFVLFLPFTHTKKGKMFPNFFLKQVKTQHKKMGGQFPPIFPLFLTFSVWALALCFWARAKPLLTGRASPPFPLLPSCSASSFFSSACRFFASSLLSPRPSSPYSSSGRKEHSKRNGPSGG